MRRSLGLRSEIVIQLFLLMAAAILFVGILLLSNSEQGMLERQIEYNRGLIELLADFSVSQLDPAQFRSQLETTYQRLRKQSSLEKLSVVGESGDVIFSRPAPENGWPVQNLLRLTLNDQRPHSVLNYTRGLLALGRNIENESLFISQPILRASKAVGVIQAKFSLFTVRKSVLKAQKIALLLIFLYGLILVLFGSYLLNKSLVRPIVTLRDVARRITAGELKEPFAAEGPREVAGLGIELDCMRQSLLENQQNAARHIKELEKLNLQLQKTRDELVQSAKMASIGHLAAGMAHEIGNPLGALMGYLDLLRKKETGNQTFSLADSAYSEACRIDRLVRDLLDYARPETRPSSPIDCREILDTTVRILIQQGILQEARLQLEIEEELPTVAIAANRLQQVLINLLQNAVDASPPDSIIALQAKTDAGEVRIVVSNLGTQIPPQDMASLFDPFYTTKSPDKGRGLGLFVCHNILNDAGGRIEATSSPEGLTRFTVFLPIGEKQHATT